MWVVLSFPSGQRAIEKFPGLPRTGEKILDYDGENWVVASVLWGSHPEKMPDAAKGDWYPILMLNKDDAQ